MKLSIPSPYFAEIEITGVSSEIYSFRADCSKPLSSVALSDLFNKIIFFLSRILWRISISSSLICTEVSIKNKIKSALSISFFALSTPILSTLSSVSRIPAVSTILSVIPSIVTDSSNVSLVVPAMSVTIALSSPKRAFKKEDFPAFGLPTIQVRIPSAIILPLS